MAMNDLRTCSEILEDAKENLGKKSRFYIGQKVYLHGNCFELEIIGIRRDPCDHIYEIEVVCEDAPYKTYKFLPEVLDPVCSSIGHLAVINGGRQ